MLDFRLDYLLIFYPVPLGGLAKIRVLGVCLCLEEKGTGVNDSPNLSFALRTSSDRTILDALLAFKRISAIFALIFISWH